MEVDFVAERPDDKLYIQVTESMLEFSWKTPLNFGVFYFALDFYNY